MKKRLPHFLTTMQAFGITFFLFLLLFSCGLAAQQHKIDSLQKVLGSCTVDTERVFLMVSISFKYHTADPDKGIELGEKALALSEEIGYKKGKADAYNSIASNYYYQGNFDKALELYSKSMAVCKEIHNLDILSMCLNNTGAIYQQRGDMINAMSSYQESMKICEQLKNKRGACDARSNIANIYFYQGELDKAKEIYEQVLEFRLQQHDSVGIAQVLSNLGGVCMTKNDLPGAKKYILRVIEIYKLLNATQPLWESYGNLASAFSTEGNIPEAIHYATEALTLCKNTGDIRGQAECLENIANIYKEAKMYDDALRYLAMCEPLFKAQKLRFSLRDMYNTYYTVYKSKGDLKNALHFHELYTQYKDSVMDENSKKEIAEVDKKYQSEKKEKEIELQNEKINTANLDLDRQRVLQYFYISAIALMSVLAFFIFRSFRLKQKSERVLEEKNRIIEEKNKDVTDSINYALRIQQAILPDEAYRKKLFPESFILFRPKDIVSGDFYWYAEKNGKKLIAAVDCTGHGVPGAFMSMIGTAFLNEIVNEKNIVQPALVLDELRNRVKVALKQTGAEGESRDGMDISLLSLDEQNGILEYAGANNPLWIIRKGSNVIEEVLPDKRPIGYFKGKGLPFTLQQLPVSKGDQCYIFTDGYADQFGGEKGKKFKYKQLKEKLTAFSGLPADTQKEKLEALFTDWKEGLEQVDDVLLIGIRM
jgi:serine phosphatase RsbU (regulator of sigma subunit)